MVAREPNLFGLLGVPLSNGEQELVCDVGRLRDGRDAEHVRVGPL